MVACRSDSEFLCCQISDGFSVHRVVYRSGRGDHADAFRLIFVKSFGSNGFNFADNEVGMVLFDDAIQCFSIEHGEHLIFIGHLHCGRTAVGVASHDILSQTLGGDRKLFPEFTRSEEQNLFHAFHFAHSTRSAGTLRADHLNSKATSQSRFRNKL